MSITRIKTVTISGELRNHLILQGRIEFTGNLLKVYCRFKHGQRVYVAGLSAQELTKIEMDAEDRMWLVLAKGATK